MIRCGDFKTSYADDMAIFDSGLARWFVGFLLLALLTVPMVASSYWMDVANRIGIAVIGASGLNILTGFTGQISLGNAAFMAVGAYSTAYLSGPLGLPHLGTIPPAGPLAAVAGGILCRPPPRLQGPYPPLGPPSAPLI